MKTMKSKMLAVLAVLLVAATAYIAGTAGVMAPRSTSAAPILYSPDTVTSVYDSARPAVVEIIVTQQGTGMFGRSLQEGQGSGFLIDGQGHILTNNHVISGASTVKVVLSNGNTVDAKVVGTDSADDLALISVDPSAAANLPFLRLADSSLMKPGQMAIAIGNPYGLTDSITVGVISGLNRSLSGSSLTGMLQTDAAINPGNSGGPLLDAQGMVIGINTAIESPSTGARGIGFAVPSNVARNALTDLLAGRAVTRAWLGISGAVLTPQSAQTLGATVTQGVYVVTVVPGSPAATAGLRAGNTDASGAPTPGGDVITAIDGRPVTSVENLRAYLITKKAGDAVTLSVARGGSTISLAATLAVWPDNLSISGAPNTPPQPQPQPQPRVPRGRRSN